MLRVCFQQPEQLDQLSNIDIECDSLLTLKAINKNYLKVGFLLQECRSLLRLRQDIAVSFGKKQTNRLPIIY